jgi:hypothetical protein
VDAREATGLAAVAVTWKIMTHNAPILQIGF